jgi:hypothetical protein
MVGTRNTLIHEILRLIVGYHGLDWSSGSAPPLTRTVCSRYQCVIRSTCSCFTLQYVKRHYSAQVDSTTAAGEHAWCTPGACVASTLQTATGDNHCSQMRTHLRVGCQHSAVHASALSALMMGTRVLTVVSAAVIHVASVQAISVCTCTLLRVSFACTHGSARCAKLCDTIMQRLQK